MRKIIVAIYERASRCWLDFLGLIRVCGVAVGIRWTIQLLLNFAEILREKNLQPADRAMGSGPFTVRLPAYGSPFVVYGPAVISGVREIYVRDVYLRAGWLRVEPGDLVLDLGANMGNFTNLALASHASVRVVAVEPSKALNDVFRKSISLNPGFIDRVVLLQAFVGAMLDWQLMASRTHDYQDAAFLAVEDLIKIGQLTRIDFLKCDIEGAEFELLAPDSKLLPITRKIACEVHHFAGDVDGFLQHIRAAEFSIGPIQRDPDGTLTFLAKRHAKSSPVLNR
jgi:FkbM family methyltransferase